ncbi:MAG: lysophospholipid acyltransferase family protein [Deltaproteobacteria bacterium]
MNRLKLVSGTLASIGRELAGRDLFPHREVHPAQGKYWLGVAANLFFQAYLGAEYLGAENIPKRGAAIIAANHLSHLDGAIINASSAMATRRPVAFLVAEDLYRANPLFRAMCRVVNCIPVKRDERDLTALRRIIRLIREGRIVGIFPEGGRSTDGSIGEGKAGVSVLALATGCPVIPAGISGTYEALPKRGRLIKPVKVRIKFGAPLRFERVRNPSEEQILRARDVIMGEIKKLHAEIASESDGKLARIKISKVS